MTFDYQKTNPAPTVNAYSFTVTIYDSYEDKLAGETPLITMHDIVLETSEEKAQRRVSRKVNISHDLVTIQSNGIQNENLDVTLSFETYMKPLIDNLFQLGDPNLPNPYVIISTLEPNC